MDILNISELIEFQNIHANSRRSLDKWQKTVAKAAWKNFSELRNDFRSADYVKEQVIFNIGGNNYRLTAWVNYNAQRVWILKVMTHNEYDRWKP